MSETVRYGNTSFKSDFLFGIDERGKTIRFSKAERILLLQFTRNPKTVVSRDRLLDAISGQGSDASDRNIDFVINRLRRKLKDSARNPLYIATQYGEGYVWVAEPVPVRADAAGAFAVIGPVRGLAHAGVFAKAARTYTAALRDALDRKTANDRKVVVDGSCPPPAEFAGDSPQFAVELNFLAHNGRLDCAITLKVFVTGQILWVARELVSYDAGAGSTIDREAVNATAEALTDAIWKTLAYPPQAVPAPDDVPPSIRMHEAALLLADVETHWRESERRLRAALADNPDDPQSQLMLATCLHARYLDGSRATILPENDFRAQDEDEMERLLMASLPGLQDNPLFVMAAGKLLYFLDRGHRPLAVDIVEKAFATGTAFASSFAILGQIRMFQGDFESALHLVDQGLELCADRSEFQIYLLVLKCQLLLAAGDRKALDDTLRLTYEKKPGARRALAILFASVEPDEADPAALATAEAVSEAQARGKLAYVNYVCARLFDDPAHRANVLRPQLALFVRRFGPGVVPEEVRASAPGMLSEVS